jgi:hypothetical protein
MERSSRGVNASARKERLERLRGGAWLGPHRTPCVARFPFVQRPFS